jgi:hypothetical protein
LSRRHHRTCTSLRLTTSTVSSYPVLRHLPREVSPSGYQGSITCCARSHPPAPSAPVKSNPYTHAIGFLTSQERLV